MDNTTTAAIKAYLCLNGSNNLIKSFLQNNGFEVMEAIGNIEDNLTQIHHFMPDVVLIEDNLENCEYVLRQIKSVAKNQNIQIILVVNNEKTEFMGLSDGIITNPINENVLIATINSHLKIKKSLDRLYENNKELSRSLYQLNVLYNTASQFTGTLNTTKLFDIMIEAMEKTLSFDMACVLLFNPTGKSILNINTIHTPSQNLTDALKIRSVLNYKTIFDDGILPNEKDFDEIELIQKVKQSRSNKIFGLEVLSYDSLFAPIKVGSDFFGVVEIFRSLPYSTEDVTCFQAISHQVALPLRSAKLYEEISITNKKLEKLEKLKSEFVSIVSHELRTPLTPINNSLEIVLSEQAGAITPDTRNFISMAKRNIQRLSGIIEDLLDLSRIQTGKLDFKYKIVDITPSLELLQKTFSQVANEKNIKINLNIEQKLPEIYADIRRIEQIFTNLVSNSIKFTSDNGEITVTARLVENSEIDETKLILPAKKLDGKYILISVKDNGIGIKQEDIPKIFDKFSQIESSLNRNKGGVGLGLTITKQLIDSHLGAIWVDSVEKQGSVFNVLLPLLSERKTFEMDVMRALTNYDDVGIIKISMKENTDTISKLKENKLLNLTALSKELFINEEVPKETKEEIEEKIGEIKNVYYACIPKITQESFDAFFKTINEFCIKNNDDIILSKAHSKKDGTDIGKIIKQLG